MYKVILFFEFLKENKNILEDLDIHDLNLETIEDKLVPLARENGFFITAKDIFRFLNEENSGLINDDMLSEVAGGKGNFNRVMATSLLAITGFTGLINNTHTYAMGNAASSVSQSESKTQSVKTIKNHSNNTLSEAEMEYYQKKIGDNYKFVSNKGMSGAFATAYKLEDENGNEFVLKIPNNPENSERWIQNQRKTDEKIKKYYKDYKGDLKIANYIKIGDDFVIEEYLGEIPSEELFQNFSKADIFKAVNGMAEFLNYTHKHERGAVTPIKFNSLNEAYNYLNDAGALNDEDRLMLQKMISDFENRDTSDEVSSLIHTDIRLQNIVYNPKTKSFALIDFDSLDTNYSIYYSFTSRTIGSCRIPHELISKIVDRYNEISDLKVNKEKIKMMHKLGGLIEVCMCCKYRDHASNEYICTKLWPGIKLGFQTIDKGFEN